MLQRIFMPGSLTTKKAESAESERPWRGAVAGITPAPVPVQRGSNSLKTDPSAPNPANAPAENETAPKPESAPSAPVPAPAPQTLQMPAVQPTPPPPAPNGTKKVGGLLDSALAEFKRRGFRLEQKPLAKPKPVPAPESRVAASGTQQAPPNPLNLRLETARPAPSKPESNAA
jgi:hypothetical protein